MKLQQTVYLTTLMFSKYVIKLNYVKKIVKISKYLVLLFKIIKITILINQEEKSDEIFQIYLFYRVYIYTYILY